MLINRIVSINLFVPRMLICKSVWLWIRDAVGDVGHASCPLSVMECLKKQAVAGFGDPKVWSEADVSVMGNIIGLYHTVNNLSNHCTKLLNDVSWDKKVP